MWKEHDGPGARSGEQLLLPGMEEWQVIREVMNAAQGGNGRFLRESGMKELSLRLGGTRMYRCGGGNSLDEGLEGECAGVWRERGGEDMPGEPIRIRLFWASLVAQWMRSHLPLQGTADSIHGPERFHVLASN